MRKILFLVIPLVASIFVLVFLKQVVKCEEPKKVEELPQPHVMTCYMPAAPKQIHLELDDYKDQLEALEVMYNTKKVTDETYNTRKNDLLKKINDLENPKQ